MTPTGAQKFNTVMGALTLLTGVTLIGASLYVAVVPSKPKPYPMLDVPAPDVESCRAALARMGFVATLGNNVLTAQQPNLDDPQAQLERASFAIAACKLPMQSFCMGSACERYGITFVLETTRGAKPGAPAASATPAPAAPGKAAPGKSAPGKAPAPPAKK